MQRLCDWVKWRSISVSYIYIHILFAYFIWDSLCFPQIERNSHRAATYLLQVMAVVDNLFLTSAGISQIFTAPHYLPRRPGEFLPCLPLQVRPPTRPRHPTLHGLDHRPGRVQPVHCRLLAVSRPNVVYDRASQNPDRHIVYIHRRLQHPAFLRIQPRNGLVRQIQHDSIHRCRHVAENQLPLSSDLRKHSLLSVRISRSARHTRRPPSETNPRTCTSAQAITWANADVTV